MLSLSKHFKIKKTHLDQLKLFQNNLSKSKTGGERTGLQFEITVKSKVEKSQRGGLPKDRVKSCYLVGEKVK
jgi:hypothetical protein